MSLLKSEYQCLVIGFEEVKIPVTLLLLLLRMNRILPLQYCSTNVIRRNFKGTIPKECIVKNC